MRAVVVSELGAPEVLRLLDIPEPLPEAGEVTIDVAYAGVNFAEVKARSVGYRVTGLPFVPGVEVSGRIRAVGAGVTGFQVGRRVAAFLDRGGYAEVVRVSADRAFALPDELELRAAATLTAVLPTAYALIHPVGRLLPQESVLVQGAAGGVGTVLGQVARLAGAAKVYGVVSHPDKAAYAKEFGYDEVFVGDGWDQRLAAATGGRGVDLALDSVGGDTWQRSLDSLARYGRLVSFGNAGGAPAWGAGVAELQERALSVASFSILSTAALAPDRLRELTAAAFELAATWDIQLPVTAEFPLERAADAHRLIESRSSTGKLLLRVSGD
ncbi:zinc-binding dehydrogenase [Streptacidiphilus sp. P02-A3a]|uniref:quinone oxidoreductase family protein n=1 Tax=Streptacidiphilus sp. P02-A3a TaxID=2704468 RepID=UPI0015F95F7B|nr:zinc-binding dehydrogenase [Streptacidiphilus sp. P02-A3a]QMU68024.1 zinc-binding dehydrogenase [Streptacidiphilus sp. P02-A3a]